MRKTAFLLLFLILLIPLSYACNAEILYYDFNPKEVENGRAVEVTARVKFTVEATDRDWETGYGLVPSCRFLVESGIVPQDVPLSLLLAVTPSQPMQCCPGNDNFQAQYFKVECESWEQLGCTREIDVTLVPTAPAEGFCDHCGGTSGNPNPSCAEDPNFYWRGPGYYVGYIGAFKGCYYDLAAKGQTQQTYDIRKFSIKVTKPPEPEPTPPTPPSPTPWYAQQVLGPLTVIDLLLLLGIPSIIGIIYVTKK